MYFLQEMSAEKKSSWQETKVYCFAYQKKPRKCFYQGVKAQQDAAAKWWVFFTFEIIDRLKPNTESQRLSVICRFLMTIVWIVKSKLPPTSEGCWKVMFSVSSANLFTGGSWVLSKKSLTRTCPPPHPCKRYHGIGSDLQEGSGQERHDWKTGSPGRGEGS